MLIGASIESATHDIAATSDSAEPAVASYAQQYSVSGTVASQRLNRIRPIHDVLAAIREAEPERVAGWGIDHGTEMVGWVLLTGHGEPSATAEAHATAHSDVEIRIGAVNTHEELLDAQQSFSAGKGLAVADHSKVISYTMVDMAANALEIGVDPARGRLGGSQATDAELQAKITAIKADYAGHFGVEFAVADGRGLSDDAMFDGGRAMEPECTSGLAAQHNDTNAYGIITAGHCRNSLTMGGVSLPHVFGRKSPSADAQFHQIPSGAGHEIRSQYKKASGVEEIHSDIQRSQMINDHVCHTGKISGVTCGTVTNVAYQPTYSGACGSETCNAVFVLVEGPALKACNGDSGGPWWRYRTAYGIHKGSNDSGNTCQTANNRRALFLGGHSG